jgi:nucleoside-diphosphate-sugar epimerase
MCLGEYDRGPTTGRLVVEIANRSLPAFVTGRRNVIYSGDAGRGVVLACEKGRPGERYLLAGTNVELRELVERIAQVAHVRAPRLAIPPRAAKMLAKILEAKFRLLGGGEPMLNSTAIAVSSGQFLDGSKAKQQLGFVAEVSLDEAIRRALEWFRRVGYVRG